MSADDLRPGFCTQCGHALHPDDLFCVGCGTTTEMVEATPSDALDETADPEVESTSSATPVPPPQSPPTSTAPTAPAPPAPLSGTPAPGGGIPTEPSPLSATPDGGASPTEPTDAPVHRRKLVPWLVAGGVGVLVVVLAVIVFAGGGSDGGGGTAPEDATVTDTDEGGASGDGPSGGSLAGAYEVEGTNPDGSAYSGTAEITGSGPDYRIEWVIGTDTFSGRGTLDLAGRFEASYSGVAAVYLLDDEGRLVGTWTLEGSPGEGTETLTPT